MQFPSIQEKLPSAHCGKQLACVPWLERISGVVLILLALGVITALLLH
jgi:succinate dehydrogenase hydrophobic anchor subunit